jgi:hypothetical protein
MELLVAVAKGARVEEVLADDRLVEAAAGLRAPVEMVAVGRRAGGCEGSLDVDDMVLRRAGDVVVAGTFSAAGASEDMVLARWLRERVRWTGCSRLVRRPHAHPNTYVAASDAFLQLLNAADRKAREGDGHSWQREPA